MLRACTFTLLTVDTRRCLSCTFHSLLIIGNSLRQLSAAEMLIHGGEDFRNRDLFRASFRTIMTGRTGNLRRSAENLLHLFDDTLLFLPKRLERLHIGQIILHLLYVGHTGQNGEDAIQRSSIADCPGRAGHILMASFKQPFHCCRRIRQTAAFYRLHDHHRFSVFSGHFVVRP